MARATTASIPNLFCPKHNDKPRQLIFVCLHSECSEKGPLCLMCCDEDHSTHRKEIEEIGVVLDKAENCYYDRVPADELE